MYALDISKTPYNYFPVIYTVTYETFSDATKSL